MGGCRAELGDGTCLELAGQRVSGRWSGDGADPMQDSLESVGNATDLQTAGKAVWHYKRWV